MGMSHLKQPFVVKVIKLLAWIGVVLTLNLTLGLAFCVSTPNNELARRFCAGVLEGAGYDPTRFSAADASISIGLALSVTLLYVLLLRSISKQWLYLCRVTATILLLAGIGIVIENGRLPVLPIIIGGLAWLPPVTRYVDRRAPPTTTNEIEPPVIGQGTDPRAGRDGVEIAATPSDKPEAPPGELGVNKAPKAARQPWTWQAVAMGIAMLIAYISLFILVISGIAFLVYQVTLIPDIFRYLPRLLSDVLQAVGNFLENLGDMLKRFKP